MQTQEGQRRDKSIHLMCLLGHNIVVVVMAVSCVVHQELIQNGLEILFVLLHDLQLVSGHCRRRFHIQPLEVPITIALQGVAWMVSSRSWSWSSRHPLAGNALSRCGNCRKVSPRDPLAQGLGSTISAAPKSRAQTSDQKAEGLSILTDVDAAALDCGTPQERWIKKVCPGMLKSLSDHFLNGSMGPKAESKCH